MATVIDSRTPGTQRTEGSSELEQFLSTVLPRQLQADDAMHNGDFEPRLTLWSHHDPVTLFGALGIDKSGGDEVRQSFHGLASAFANFTPITFELVAAGVSGDLAYTVGYERSTGSVNGRPPRLIMLRVTNVYRREEGEWKIVHSNGGTLITAVADRVPERLAHLVYLDAFVPEDGQATIDLVSFPRKAWDARVQTEGYGWLVPSLQSLPWDEFVRYVWHVTDEADRQWMVERLGPTPFKVFTDRVTRTNPAAEALPRTYIRCLHNIPMPAFDRFAEAARNTPGWQYRELDTAHEPFITHPEQLADLLLEVSA